MNRIIYLILAFTVTMVVACDDDGEETMSWKPGSSLHIVGPDEVVVGEDNEYYVDGFTVKEDYQWTLNGSSVTPIREGEFVVLNIDAPGTYTLAVSNGKYDGSMEIVAE